MRDVMAYPGWHAPTSAFARDLAARLCLRPVDLPWPGFAVDAALAVTPVALRSYVTPTTPAVVLTRRAVTGRRRPSGSLVCGVQDDDDAPCVAIAAALAERLGLPLVLVHVVASVPVVFGSPYGAPVAIPGRTSEDRAAGGDTLHRVARAAGLRRPETAGVRLLHGIPGPTLAATARRERAAAVVVSRSRHGRLQRALLGSAPDYLLRRCDRPVVLCPRDTGAAMRVRAALTPRSSPRATLG